MKKKPKGGFGVKKNHETGLYAREFAALYGLTRETLLYYDKIGLFHPALRGENGYRLYALDQIPQFDFLLLLRDAGVPLSDIRQVLQTATPQQTLALLRTREEKVRDQIKALRRLEKRIAFTAGRMETGLHTVCEHPRIEEWDTAYYLSFPAGPEVWGDRYRRIAFVRRILKQYGERSPGCFVRSSLITREHLLQGRFEKDCFCLQVETPDNQESLLIRPRGLYAVMEHRGPYQSLPRAYEALLMFIRQNGYTVTGHGYESDLLGYAAVRRDEDYMVQIAIGVSSSAP